MKQLTPLQAQSKKVGAVEQTEVGADVNAFIQKLSEYALGRLGAWAANTTGRRAQMKHSEDWYVTDLGVRNDFLPAELLSIVVIQGESSPYEFCFSGRHDVKTRLGIQDQCIPFLKELWEALRGLTDTGAFVSHLGGVYDFWLETLEASVPLWTEWVKSWEAVGLLRQASPLILKQHGGVHALSLGNKQEGPVCRLLRGMQGLFIPAFMHAMWLELLRSAKLGTEGTQLALRTAMKVEGPGVKKEKGDISDDDMDVDAEIEEGNATAEGVSMDAGNIPNSKEKKGTEQTKGKGKQKGGKSQTSSAAPADVSRVFWWFVMGVIGSFMPAWFFLLMAM